MERRLGGLSLSQKISLTFALFFLVNTVQQLVDHGGMFADPFAPYGAAALLLFLGLARFDSSIARYTVVILLVVLSIVSVWLNDDPSHVTPFVLLSVGLSAAYKMNLFGRRTSSIIGWAAGIVVATTVVSATVHDYTAMQRINVVMFVLVYLALLFFLFEEETLTLRKQRDLLSTEAESIKPFAELGSNVAGLVHDFKGDVSGLYALATIERLSQNDETARKLQYYADRLNERIDSVLYVATAGDHTEVEEVNVGEMLDRVVYYFVGVNRSLKHAVRIQSDAPADILVRTRRNLMLVILENVIKNSVEATEGFPERRVWIRAREERGTLTITVEHHGSQLPGVMGGSSSLDVRRSHYFRRGRSHRDGGTGLGMINVIRALDELDAEMTMKNLANGVVSTIRHPDAHRADTASGREKSPMQPERDTRGK